MLNNLDTIARLKTDNRRQMGEKLKDGGQQESSLDRNSIAGFISSIPLLLAAVAVVAAAAAIYTFWDDIKGFFGGRGKDKKPDSLPNIGPRPYGLPTDAASKSAPAPLPSSDMGSQPAPVDAKPGISQAVMTPRPTPSVSTGGGNTGPDTEGVRGPKLAFSAPQPGSSTSALQPPVSGSSTPPPTVSTTPPLTGSGSNLRATEIQVMSTPTAGTRAETSSPIGQLIIKAAKAVGVSSGFMLAMAKQESGFNPNAKATTSSASGLFQPLAAVWKELVGKYGQATGVKIDQIMDPAANSLMAAYLLRDNIASLTRNGITKIGYTEMYAAHFLGPSGARVLLSNLNDTTLAKDLLPSAARANFNVFYKKDQTPRTTNELYQWLTAKIEPNAALYAASIPESSITLAAADYTRQELSDKNKQVVVNNSAANPTSAPVATAGSGPNPPFDIVAGKLVVSSTQVTRA